ncbi:acetylornithine deacetylase [Salinisphaera sp. PC39]|uniref:acetylornithine deacetylase n=1 Tax=Salinisphaera sp. PC39 TaxID=1304156 RepID=UPI0033406783
MSRCIPEFRDLFADLVACRTVSCADPAWDTGNREAAERLAGWLDELGFDCTLHPLPERADKVNLVARLGPDTGGESGLALAGHLDTVPYDKGKWTSDPFSLTERDGRLHGLGTADMKGFLALAADVARDYRARALNAPLVILASADEECGMDGARALAAGGPPPARYAVIGEPTGLVPIARHKGIFMEAVAVGGRAGHSSNPAHGINSIEGMRHVLDAVLDYRDDLAGRGGGEGFPVPHATLNAGVLRGGDSPNRIPARCELQLDLRFLPGDRIETLRDGLRERVRAALADGPWSLDFTELFVGTPAFETPADSPIVRAAAELTGESPAAVDFGTEGAFYNDWGMDTVILGPGDIAQAHQPDEYLALDRIEPMKRILHGLIERFCV